MIASDRQIVETVAALTHANGYPPTVDELRHALGYRSKAPMQYRLTCLVDRGVLVRDHAGLARAVTVAHTERRFGDLARVD